MASIALLFLLVGCLSSGTLAANILYINSVASPSHFGWNRALIYALAAKGHNLTVFGVDSDPNPPPNVTFILLENVYEKLYSDPNMDTDFFEMSKMNAFSMQILFNDYVLGVCQLALATDGAKRLYDYPSDFGFDLIVHDYLSGPCLAALAYYRFQKPPVVAVTAYHGASTTLSMTGAYQYSALLPNHAYDAPEDMSYQQRVINLLVNLQEELLQKYGLLQTSNNMLREYEPALPDVEEFYRETKLVLLNANPIIQYTEPLMPNVIPVGGLQIIKPKPLPADLASLLDSAGPGGVIVFSLGTNVRSDTLGEARILAILRAMETLPEYTFLWKFESDAMPRALPKNVNVRKWLPQNDLLSQPAVRLFITHSGLLSTQEAIWHGVPIIGFPVFADQYKNINYCVERGVGKRLNIADVNTEELVGAIREIMTTESYRTNMKRMSDLFRDQPEHPLDRAVWWVEWVLRHPDATEMLTHGTRLHWFVKYSYDVLIPLFGAIAILCYGLFLVTRRLLFRKKGTKQKHKKS
ncbi:UDP-glucosyltransferase 2-like [Anopheles nili]|uniref:UDP-glucosyltransferase 2-like n=1 Tax=Anopheles nili TaxID=185578 RepID=UPI00237AFF9D|nr:UDP-glucosyltransferase 2-like [Anopheles nili]